MTEQVAQDVQIVISMTNSHYEFVELSSLDMNPAQPPLRSTEKAIEGLRARVLKSKFITPIVVASGQNGRHTIIDGHRRYAVSLLLGLRMIPAVILRDVDPIDMFIDLGYGTKNFTGPTWFTIWAKSGEHRADKLARCSADIRNKILKMVKVFGEERAIELAIEGRVSPGAADLIVKLYERKLVEVLQGAVDVSLQRTGEWVLKHKCQRAIEDQNLVKQGYSKGVCREIISWVKKDVPWGGA